MNNYTQAAEFLGKKTDRPIGTGRATRIHRLDEHSIAISLHGTNVVVYHDDGTITLNSGGWRTYTTKERINEYSPARVCQTKGIWHIYRWRADHTVETAAFYDGVKVGADGWPVEPETDKDDTALQKELDRKIRKFVLGFRKHVEEHGLETPQAGDCLGCYFTAAAHAKVKTGTQTGHGRLENGKIVVDDTTGKPEPLGFDHYISHIEEGYYVPSLLFNAFVTRGYGGGPQIGYQIAARHPEEVNRVLNYFFRKHRHQLFEEYKKSRQVGEN